jgi:diguanylate cyclase (GGDEF)-like protein
MKILAVDDSKTLLLLLSVSLKKLGHKIVTTTDPKQALELFKKEQPDLVILDIIMTDEMDGYDCAKLIRKEGDKDDWIPIIFLSSLVNDKNIAAGIDAGGDDYLTKPFSEITLAAKIKAMQRIAEMRQKIIKTTHQLEEANEKLYDLSYTDGLTKVANRRAFDKGLVNEWRRASRLSSKKDRSVSLIMIDIDHFKFYNDTYGHQAGDECLQTVAKILGKELCRSSNMLYRYGGEEFVVLLPHTDKKAAMEIAEGMRKSLEKAGIKNKGSKVAHGVLTISLGVATMQAEKKFDPMKLLNTSDMALYDAKTHGRNKVSFKKS